MFLARRNHLCLNFSFLSLASVFLLTACSKGSSEGEQAKESESQDGEEAGAGEDEGTKVEPEESNSGEDETSTNGDDLEEDSETDGGFGGGFLDRDVAGQSECSPWDQDCPDGEKCVPYSTDTMAETTVWNANKCSPVLGSKSAGDDCTHNVEDGTDDCDENSVCWHLSEEEGGVRNGTCRNYCQGTANDPECEDADFTCLIANEGVLNFCIPGCDPLLQNCGDDRGCYWDYMQEFLCVEPARNAAQPGEACSLANACVPGGQCISAALIPDCPGDTMGCCTAYCDLSAESDECPGAIEETFCTPVFMEDAPPEYRNVGFCVFVEE